MLLGRTVRIITVAVCCSLAFGCVTREEGPTGTSLDVAEVARHIPSHVGNRGSWAADILRAIEATSRPATAERVCAVVAVIEQESGFRENPVVAGLPEIVRAGLLAKLKRLGPLARPALDALLAGRAPGAKETFGERIAGLRTERDLDRFFRDIRSAYEGRLPGTYAVASALSRLLGPGRFEDLNPVTTAGSMQVKVAFARTLPEFAELDDAAIREKLYTRAGGIRAGVARLLDYQASYDDVIYRFADYNAGPYASRNAAFQALLGSLTGHELRLDGDLIAYADDGDPGGVESESLKAMLAFGEARDMWRWPIRRAAGKEKTAAFESTGIWEAVRKAWQEAHGAEPPYARLPEVTLSSPKLSGERSTAWFAKSVKRRYVACRARG